MQTREYLGLGVLVVVLFVAYKKGLFSLDKGRKLDPAKTATDGSSTTLAANQYTNKANSIHTSLQSTGQGIFGDLGTIISDLLALGEADLIAIANEYARLYPNDQYPTLYSIIQGTTTVIWTDTYYKKYELLEKLKKLGL